ncbi:MULTISPECIES: translocation and assembly module lipoprotein TamL [Chryseobacterium]|uniref:Outer membrane protein insertion porin family n=1 Tax=Chryseobacterium camelliae TaxID=1265445 RepID=A0ABU0TKH2_9FLAO|nr:MULTISPECIES: BamA/TamA family outer membrane protein [Chryseobacterium]MDQ1097541.1 outer membrane protein insertion porin family [Chryseobacterium camelliae]MDQ1101471.1 outer membrane protein insertion porin family [Chryseobacterium sp. SORGH_AS_1048]MDR6084914.1 outer membrane protein insertion porin family [Chryseobacterium sp. SORGH_AS_0909]MDT3408604.1 outer membrane protein insertion porin family [Pseudacidovorax intermedius]
MKNRFNRYLTYALASGISSAVVSCSNTKYLKQGQMLYTGAEVKIENDTLPKKEKNALKSELESNLTPKPNSSFLGLRPRLFFYNITKEPKKEKGLRYWLKYKVGEKPVLLSDVDQEFNRDIIENYSENQGYFNARATYDTISKNRKAEVIYTLRPGARYLISDVKFQRDSTVINQEIQKLTGNTLLKPGNPFDLDVIKSERQRIDNGLKERGFYYFHPDNIIVQADSTVSKNHKVELNVKLKDNTPALATQQFSIDKVIVFPNYNILDVKNGKYTIPVDKDSLSKYAYEDIYVIDPQHKFKPKIFDRALYFKTGDLYNRTDHNLTLNRLISLGVFKFVKNEFVVSDSLQHRFDAYYLLTPRELQSLRLEALGRTNSANYAGSELNLNWTHRNFFRGAEQFKAAVYGAFDVQVGGPKDANNIFRAGANAQLSIPRIVAPFRFNSSSAFVPRTNITLGYEFQNRTQLYTLNTFNASFGYVWKENARKEHDLKIIDVTYVSPANITPKFQEQASQNPYLQRVVDKQLIFGPTYSYTYTNTMLPKTNTIYYKGMVDLAGNLTGLLSGANAKEGKQKTIFDVPFSQYVKMEHDFRFYHKFAEKTSFASRIIAGIAYPYGNSVQVPYSRQFFVGGSNSIRAFRARTLGPGSYDPRTQKDTFFFDQSGDIKLEMNAEYRANLYKFLNVAVFADAGNIWLVNADEQRPGGQFSKDFLSEVAVGAGVGLRLDFSILVLRLDLAMPLRVPYYEKGDRWTFDRIDFGNSDWRKDNLILNIAIGYPF